MDDPRVTAAYIAGLASVAVAVTSFLLGAMKIVWDWRQTRHERKLAAREGLDRLRHPLLSAVDELGNRIDNLRNYKFFGTYACGNRRGEAMASTIFRFAQYFAWTEILYASSGQYRFTADKKTVEVADTIGWVASAFANWDLDQEIKGDRSSSRLMLWREEQRAIGELMRADDKRDTCIGYQAFEAGYKKRHARWFAAFPNELVRKLDTSSGNVSSERLDYLQGILAKLLQQLDVDGAVVQVRNGKLEPTWTQEDRYTSLDDWEKELKQRADRAASQSGSSS